MTLSWKSFGKSNFKRLILNRSHPLGGFFISAIRALSRQHSALSHQHSAKTNRCLITGKSGATKTRPFFYHRQECRCHKNQTFFHHRQECRHHKSSHKNSPNEPSTKTKNIGHPLGGFFI